MSSSSLSEAQKQQQLAKLKNTRRRHKNSHNGCKNCKQRRIKCDENLPECMNCNKLSQSRVSSGGTYTRCSYLDMSQTELRSMMSKSQSPQPVGVPLKNSNARVGNHRVKTYANKSPFFKNMFATFDRLQKLALADRGTVMNRQMHGYYLRIHLTKMLLLSSVADIYFQSFLSFSCNYLKRTVSESEDLYHKLSLKFFGNSVKCQKRLISNVPVLTPCHYNYLTSSTMLLSWNSIYQESELHAYASFTTGILSIIGTALQSQQLKTDTLSLEVAGDNIVQSFKACFIPSYDPEFLNELYGNLITLDTDMIEHKNLVKFVKKLMQDLQSGDQKLNSMSTYSPKFMYNLLIDWYSILPPDLFNVGYEGFEMDETKYIVMCYYLTMGQALFLIFPEVQFFFSVGFIGIFPQLFSDAFKKSNYHLAYLARVHNFLKMRIDILFNEIKFKSLDFFKNEDVFVKGVKLTNIQERYIKNFCHTIIKPENYPHNKEDMVTGGDVLFMALQNFDESFEESFNNLTYREIDLKQMWLKDFNSDTGFLVQDYQPEMENLTHGDNKLILANPETLEIVYKIRLRLLHS